MSVLSSFRKWILAVNLEISEISGRQFCEWISASGNWFWGWITGGAWFFSISKIVGFWSPARFGGRKFSSLSIAVGFLGEGFKNICGKSKSQVLFWAKKFSFADFTTGIFGIGDLG